MILVTLKVVKVMNVTGDLSPVNAVKSWLPAILGVTSVAGYIRKPWIPKVESLRNAILVWDFIMEFFSNSKLSRANIEKVIKVNKRRSRMQLKAVELSKG